jgi:hypothetical protein
MYALASSRRIAAKTILNPPPARSHRPRYHRPGADPPNHVHCSRAVTLHRPGEGEARRSRPGSASPCRRFSGG